MSEDKVKQEVAEEKATKEKASAEGGKKKKSTSSKSRENKKIKTLEARVTELSAERDQLKDQLLRKMAEFENYKRRTEKEFLAHLENANEGLITELLPVIDDFERSMEHARKEKSGGSLLEGIELVYKNMMDVLSKKGLKVMDVIGQEFDAEMHQALVQVESDQVESGHIADQHLKGYTLNDKVIRHAQVLVAK